MGRRSRRRASLSGRRRAARAMAARGALRGASDQCPRPADAVDRQLARIGLPRSAYDFVATSGEAGIEALVALKRPVGFVGTAGDREILEGTGSPNRRGRGFHRARLHWCRGGTAESPGISPRPGAVGRARRPHALPQPRPAGDPRRCSRSLRRRHRRPLSGARRPSDVVREATSGDLRPRAPPRR